MLVTSDYLFLSQLVIFGLFEVLSYHCRNCVQRRTPSDTVNTRGDTGHAQVGTVNGNSTNSKTENSLEGLSATFVELQRLKQKAIELDHPSTFVEHAKISRKAVALQKQWDLEYAFLNPEDKIKHDSYNKYLNVSDAGPSPILSGEIPSIFGQVMRSDMAQEDRQQLYGSILRQFTGGGSGHKKSWLTILIQYSSLLRLLVSWAAIHAIVGWSRGIKGLPLFAFPVNYIGGLRMPLSWFASPVSSDAAFEYVLDQNLVGSESNFASAPWQCTHFATINFITTTILFDIATKHIKHHLLSRQGRLRRACDALRVTPNGK